MANIDNNFKQLSWIKHEKAGKKNNIYKLVCKIVDPAGGGGALSEESEGGGGWKIQQSPLFLQFVNTTQAQRSILSPPHSEYYEPVCCWCFYQDCSINWISLEGDTVMVVSR
jgi:hypothetical protein